MSDDIKLGSMFGSSIRIEVNIDGVKKVESIVFSSQSIDHHESNGLYAYVSEVAKDAVKSCMAENK